MNLAELENGGHWTDTVSIINQTNILRLNINNAHNKLGKANEIQLKTKHVFGFYVSVSLD